MAEISLPPRSYPRDTWRWIWPDVFIRLVPFWFVALLVAHFTGGIASVGFIAPPQGWLAAFAVGIPVGVAMMACAIFWRARTAPRYRLPTSADQTLQTFFYLILNAPTEEIFWRGVLQTAAIRGCEAIGVNRGIAITLGIIVISIIFGAYHRLGGYQWNFNIAAMFAGGIFGILYALLPGPSIVVPAIVHGLTTAGYLSWGDAALHHQQQRRERATRY